MKYLIFANYSDLIVHHFGSDYVSAIKTLLHESPSPFDRVSLDNWQDLGNISSDSLFGDNLPSLINRQELDINSTFEQFYNSTLGDAYLYSSSKNKLKKEEKETLKSNNIEVIEIKKPDKNKKQEFITSYLEFNQVSADSKSITNLTKEALSYDEIINTIDMGILSEQLDKTMQGVDNQEVLPFMFSLKPGNLDGVSKWYKHIKQEEIQLALALMITKASKLDSETKKTTLSRVIAADQNIKTGQLSDTLAWKQLLWQLATHH